MIACLYQNIPREQVESRKYASLCRLRATGVYVMCHLRRLLPFRDERVVLTLFSPAMIAGEPLPHLTNFHDLLTNIHQTPSAIAGAKRSPPVRCVQAPVHRVVHMPWQILLSNEVSCASTGERSPHTVGQICVRERGACRCSSSPGDWDRMTGLARFEASLLSVRGHCRKRISCPHHE